MHPIEEHKHATESETDAAPNFKPLWFYALPYLDPTSKARLVQSAKLITTTLEAVPDALASELMVDK